MDSLDYDYQYFKLTFNHSLEDSEFRMLMVQMIASILKSGREKEARANPNNSPFSRFFNDNFPALKATVTRVIALNQNLCERRKIRVEQFLTWVVIVEGVGVLVLTAVFLWLARRLIEKIKDTLHLFCKISKRDTKKYMIHFEDILQQFKDGHPISTIL